jgi:outer membrane translocation and assembly module TamA
MKGKQYVPFVDRSILIKFKRVHGGKILKQKLHCLPPSLFVASVVPS